ncbi:MAG: muconate cycloisomerase [Planctomycetaceae bacterium]|nr:muconate cycloisomerase [Planctomycetales bacterium]MCB9922021.1 muconate cycloisomerase [Planctomycetaceae bacterium]
MKITAIETYPVRIALKPDYQMITSLGVHDVSNYLLVRVLTDNGFEGVGEATVSEKWSGETVVGAKWLIENVLAPQVVGCDPSDIEEVDRRMDAVCRHNWFAKSSIEMACWDLQGKSVGKPVYELLGGACRSLSIRCRYSMGAYTPERARERAVQLVEQGFETIKVKVGTQPEIDLRRVRAVREAIGRDRHLMIDANCGWDVETAIRCINDLEDCNLWLVEQPTPDGDYEGLARVRRETRPPVMADDICFDMAHLVNLIRHESCDLISLYPGKNGGIRKAKAMAEFAARHGVACSIGSNLEYDIATAAMCHMVVATSNMKIEEYPGDILGPSYHVSSVVTNPIAIEGPVTTITNAPGLGVEVDWDRVARLA